MKTKRLFPGMLSLLIFLTTGMAMAQGPYPNQGPHIVCIGDIAPYGVISTTGSTYNWSVIPLAGGGGTIAPGNTNLTSVTWTSAGTCNLRVTETTSEGCTGTAVEILVTIRAANTMTLTSAAGTNNQSVCLNSAMVPITWSTTGATGATVTGLPAGINSSWSSGVISISGTPTVTGTFSYTVTLTGGCGNVSSTGSITVTPAGSITLSSGAGTNNQNVCNLTAIETISYATSGYTSGTVTGLPAGVTATLSGSTVSIGGTPTIAGTFNYTVTLNGTCGTLTATGTIIVNPVPVTSPIYHN